MAVQGDPPGRVSQAFQSAVATIQALNGPVGGGKTTTLFQKASLVMPMLQPPSPIDAIRRRVVTVVHQDYRKLWRGPIPTWLKIWPKEGPAVNWTGGRNDPAVHHIRYRHAHDHGLVELTVNFIAIGDDDPEDVMRGYETTDWLLMEGDLLSEEVFKYAITRLARAPGREHGEVFNPYIGIDFNAPEFDSWVFRKMTEEWEENVELFRQPPAAHEPQRGAFVLNPDAENLHNLDPGYYQRQIDILKKDDIDLVRRFVCNQPGYSKLGLAVYAEDYDDHYHVARNELEPDPRLPLHIGADAGGDPCAAIGQIMPDGQARVLHELISKHGTGPERFGDDLNELLAAPRFQSFDRRQMTIWPDPSSFYGGDAEATSLNDMDWASKVRAKTKIDVRVPHSSNALNPRLKAVRDKLRWPNSYPGLLLCPKHCPMLRKGFMRGYHYGEVKRAGGGGTHRPYDPVKNEFSHPHDALQYLLLGAQRYPDAGAGDRRRQTRAGTPGNPQGEWRGNRNRPERADLRPGH